MFIHEIVAKCGHSPICHNITLSIRTFHYFYFPIYKMSKIIVARKLTVAALYKCLLAAHMLHAVFNS